MECKINEHITKNYYHYNYLQRFCVKTLFRLTAFHCSQINLRTDLRSLKKALRIIYIYFFNLSSKIFKSINHRVNDCP